MASLKDLDRNTMVVTSTYVMNDGLPILYVSNDFDEDGGSTWQFHCDNGDYNMEKMLLVRFENILKKDKGLLTIKLEIGEEAKRKSIKSDWIINKQA